MRGTQAIYDEVKRRGAEIAVIGVPKTIDNDLPYIERTFGPIFGTIAGLGLWLSLLLKSAFALVGVGAYL